MTTLLKQHEAASILRLSVRTLERLRVEGLGPKFVRPGKSVRYRQADLDQWEEWKEFEPKPKPKVGPRLGFLPLDGSPPKSVGKAANYVGPPETEVAQSVFEDAQSKSEPVQAVPIGFTQSPTIAPVVADGGALCLNPAAPFDNAQKLVSLRAWHPGERIRTWQFWQKSFWQWSGTHWCEVDDDTVRA
jgi:hypothetical protein